MLQKVFEIQNKTDVNWCKLVRRHRVTKMNETSTASGNGAKRNRPKVDARATVGFDPETYEQLQDIAFGKNIPVAFVVREAVASYLSANGYVQSGRNSGK
jgi:hypothetical protein